MIIAVTKLADADQSAFWLLFLVGCGIVAFIAAADWSIKHLGDDTDRPEPTGPPEPATRPEPIDPHAPDYRPRTPGEWYDHGRH